jgi:hypothetical protein
MLVVALLVLIVLILLFGAAAVKGWLANALILGCSLIAIVVAVAWVSTLLGVSILHVAYGIGGLLLVGSLWARSQQQ